jgi:diguanylate cyclase
VTGRRELVLSIMQLNNFLEIQNTFGAAFGMRVLAQVVDRAQRLVPPKSLLALVQPDRLVSVVRGEEVSQTMREGIETAVTESYFVDGVPIHVAASIGVAHFPDHAGTAEELLQKASIAMHWATSSKSALSLYTAPTTAPAATT